MYREMLEAMKEGSAARLREKRNAQATWFNEWADLFLKAYQPGQKVVSTSIYAFPMELLAAFDVVPFDFEIAASMVCATEMGVPAMCEAEGRGYALDVCSFHRAGLGGFYRDYFPKPELFLTTSYFCDGKVKTNEILSRLHSKECLLLYVPAEINRDSLRYVEKQLRHIASKIGEVAGQRLDEDRLKEAVRSSNRARRSHLALLEVQKHRPAPLSPRLIISFSINGLLFSGRETKERLNQELLAEARGRIESGALRPERHRFYWFAWMPVYQSGLFDFLKEKQIGVPLCETFRVHWDEIDENRPFEGLALKCLNNPFVGPVGRRTEGLEKIVEEYAIDGAVKFVTPACRHSNNGAGLLKNSLQRLGIPLLQVEMDIGDPRGYSPGQTRTRLESFVEVLSQ